MPSVHGPWNSRLIASACEDVVWICASMRGCVRLRLSLTNNGGVIGDSLWILLVHILGDCVARQTRRVQCRVSVGLTLQTFMNRYQWNLP